MQSIIIGKATDLKTPCTVDTKRQEEYIAMCKAIIDMSNYCKDIMDFAQKHKCPPSLEE